MPLFTDEGSCRVAKRLICLWLIWLVFLTRISRVYLPTQAFTTIITFITVNFLPFPWLQIWLCDVRMAEGNDLSVMRYLLHAFTPVALLPWNKRAWLCAGLIFYLTKTVLHNMTFHQKFMSMSHDSSHSARMKLVTSANRLVDSELARCRCGKGCFWKPIDVSDLSMWVFCSTMFVRQAIRCATYSNGVRGFCNELCNVVS